jgi:hypothetical protein
MIASKCALSQELGADWVVYSDLDSMVSSVMSLSSTGPTAIDRLDCSCFDGKYVTGDIDEAYFEQLRQTRSDAALTAARCATPDVSRCNAYYVLCTFAKACSAATTLIIAAPIASSASYYYCILLSATCQWCAL